MDGGGVRTRPSSSSAAAPLAAAASRVQGIHRHLSGHFTFGAYGDRSQPRPIIRAAISGNYSAQAIALRNLHFIGVSLLPGYDTLIANTVIENSSVDGIHADKMNNVTIVNSSFINNGSPALAAGFAGGGKNLQILNSTFLNNGRDTTLSHNIYARELTGALIQGNLLIGGSNLGMVVHGMNTDLTIRGNEFRGNSNGLMLSGGYTESEYFKNVLIERNLIHDNGYRTGEQGYGMLLQSLTGAVVRNNIVYGNRLGTLSLGDKSSAEDLPLTNVQMMNNLFSDPSLGYGSFAGAQVKNLSLFNNIFMSYGSNTCFSKI